ncbi:conserved hypothetical protein [Candidatus Nitrosotenuis uzonensis]|uniref:Uncharacterized protein n=1 Tax=Candidatus Nitrosotenuis uzonensis TaxID=1407055 RepID=A0A812F1S4_9ARCH|nr:conserved hypothetical protein [Candidatus Nitrosotenuis uzonensis]
MLIAIILIKKIFTTSAKTSFKIGIRCQRCGYKTNGLKCPRCENASDHQRWR